MSTETPKKKDQLPNAAPDARPTATTSNNGELEMAELRFQIRQSENRRMEAERKLATIREIAR
jgi:hypothetical protein